MIADGSLIARPAQTDETAMRLLRLLSIVSRRRWPDGADPAPAVGVPPPKKKKAAAAKTDEPKPDEAKAEATNANEAKTEAAKSEDAKPKD
jgi:hypothetical protein